MYKKVVNIKFYIKIVIKLKIIKKFENTIINKLKR